MARRLAQKDPSLAEMHTTHSASKTDVYKTEYWQYYASGGGLSMPLASPPAGISAGVWRAVLERMV